jgi:hypothetical protein
MLTELWPGDLMEKDLLEALGVVGIQYCNEF